MAMNRRVRDYELAGLAKHLSEQPVNSREQGVENSYLASLAMKKFLTAKVRGSPDFDESLLIGGIFAADEKAIGQTGRFSGVTAEVMDNYDGALEQGLNASTIEDILTSRWARLSVPVARVSAGLGPVYQMPYEEVQKALRLDKAERIRTNGANGTLTDEQRSKNMRALEAVSSMQRMRYEVELKPQVVGDYINHIMDTKLFP